MMDEGIKNYLGRIILVIIVCISLVFCIFYMNARWARIRDIRRQADAHSIVKALDVYNIQVGYYPQVTENDGDGWDKTNDPARSFLKPLSDFGLINSLIFDPKNDNKYYYRYQKFPAGTYGCSDSFAVFQIASFEAAAEDIGRGSCPYLNWTSAAPKGFTWFGLD